MITNRSRFWNETHPFLNNASQYRANNSGDLVVVPAVRVTALLLINLPQAYNDFISIDRNENEMDLLCQEQQ